MSIPAVDRPALLDPIDESVWPERTTVLIVGGGPVGLSAAIMLAQRGIDVVLLERRGFEARFPRAHLLNVRTMEAFHAMGVADDIYEQGPADDRWHKVVWYTSVAGQTPADGVKLGEVPAWGGGPDAVRYAEASPRSFANLPQLRLDPLLYAHAAAACPGRIRAWQELVDIRNEQDGVVATCEDRESGERHTIRADYAIMADGGRASDELLDTGLEGPTDIREIVNFHVTTDLSMWAEPDALLCFFFHPAGGTKRMGTIQALGPDSYDRKSREWLIAVPSWLRRGDGPEAARESIREMLGLPAGHPIDIHSENHWVYNGVVARRWRHERIFIAGDAAHRHPPTGGLGLNSGVQDAENLVWKLAAVLAGEAEDSLLDSYEWERRPLTAYYTAHSLENAAMHAPIAAALGLGPDEAASRHAVEVFRSDTPEGGSRRRAVARAVGSNAHDYSQLGVEAGFFYSSGALVPDGSPVPEGLGSPTAFVPTTRPGHHLPHVWLHAEASEGSEASEASEGSEGVGGARVSTRDLVHARGLTLFVGEAAAGQWRAAVDSLGPLGPVHLVEVPAAETAWSAVREVGEDGAVLVRPDAKNAWRVARLPADPGAELRDAVATILRGGTAPVGDPAEGYLRRIREVAATLAE